VVLINLSGESQTFELPASIRLAEPVLDSTGAASGLAPASRSVELAPWQATVYRGA